MSKRNQQLELSLERFKDWYLKQMEPSEWKKPLAKHIQLLEGEESLTDLVEDIKHYYKVHMANTWGELEFAIEDSMADHGQSYSEYLQAFIIDTQII